MIDRVQSHAVIPAPFARDEDIRQSGDLQRDSENPTQADESQSQGDRLELSESEDRQVQKLQKRDREVRAHERAHMAAGSGIVQGGASFTYQRGPDGHNYAVGGEVKIDTSSESDPESTIRKMQQVKRAALAPAEPSGTDRAVAAQAGRIEAQARQEKTKLENTEAEETESQVETQAAASESATSGRRPYSTEDVGQMLNIAV